ncbi:hypothetical protein RJ640_020888 [Escallonia rubra]|uniref:Cytochrome P450 n=1 Tax=Escallonia rubra TaxID=112253 RepID=A0AA88QKV7_9ASTE|nr:hypothetical protein RJ640_020888 [Escallonia rubra]
MVILPLFFLLLLPVFLLFFVPKWRKSKGIRHLPGPPGLPFVGNLHQLDNSDLQRYLWQLSKKYGPIMSLRLGFVPALVISSAKMAKEVLKTHDLVFCSRPALFGQQKLSYNGLDVALSPYNDYWREMRKICTLHLFSSRRVQSARPIREDEVSQMIQNISQLANSGRLTNLSETLMTLTSTIICRVAFGRRYDGEGHESRRFHKLLHECEAVMASFYVSDYFPFMGWFDKLTGMCARLEKNFEGMDLFYQELIDEHLNPNRPESMKGDFIDILLQLEKDGLSSIHLTSNHIKALLMNILLGGTDTSASAVVWTMMELVKHPAVMKKAQEEVRKLIGNRGKVDEDDLQNLPYLKAVIKEGLRLHPPAPLLVPRETIDRCVIEGYEIKPKTLVYVNAWAVGRDPESWENPEEYVPERFLDSSIDFKGQDFQLIPFGAGRRGCPGVLIGITTVELVLSNLLYSFDWELPDGMKIEDIDEAPMPGITVHKKNALCLLARRYLWQLSKKYGPIMSLRLGFVPALVISSAKMAKEVLKTHDLAFCSRPALFGQQKLSYNGLDVALSPYNDYWREMRKICTLHLFSSRRVQSARPIREDEVSQMIKNISQLASSSKLTDLSETLVILTCTIVCRVAFGKRYDGEGHESRRFYKLFHECQAVMASFYVSDHFPLMGWFDKLTGMCARLERNFKDMDLFYEELIDEHRNPDRPESMQDDFIDILLQLEKDGLSSIHLTSNHIKALLMNILLGGTDTSASTVVWTMVELVKHPIVMKKAQEEVRKLIGNRGKVDEDDLQNLPYLKAVIMEGLRLHPPVPLLIPRETIDRCVIEGYEIKPKTLVYVNAWAVGRDPESWENPEEYVPERFLDKSIDYKGQADFQLIPFGGGRRGCPGMLMGTTTVELVLSNLLYSFDWELPDGMKIEDIDSAPMPGLVVHKKNALCLLAKVHKCHEVE